MESDKLNQFLNELEGFLESANANLGRKASKNRLAFINQVLLMVKNFAEVGNVQTESEDILCMKPTPKNSKLIIKDGIHAMTQSEAMRADEELGRSPY